MLPALHFLALSACVLAAAGVPEGFTHYSRTASINGFADLVINDLPECAKECVSHPTKNTPCPYWDAGCLCLIPNWSGPVAACFVAQCTDVNDLNQATAAGYSMCSSIGALQWILPKSVSNAMINAAAANVNAAADSINPASSTEAETHETASQSAAITSMPATSATVSATAAATTVSSVSSAASSSVEASSAASVGVSASENAGNSVDQMTSIAALLSVVVLSLLA